MGDRVFPDFKSPFLKRGSSSERLIQPLRRSKDAP
jgi:hypothetical protein